MSEKTFSTGKYIFLEVPALALLGFSLYSGLANVALVSGLIFITSPLLKKYFLISRAFYWVSDNILRPKTKYNAYIWGNFLLFFGIFSPLSKGNVDSSQTEMNLFGSIEFWLIVLFVIIANLIIGVITFKKSR